MIQTAVDLKHSFICKASEETSLYSYLTRGIEKCIFIRDVLGFYLADSNNLTNIGLILDLYYCCSLYYLFVCIWLAQRCKKHKK